MNQKHHIYYSRNNGILHVRVGRYHALIGRDAGIVRNEYCCVDRWLWGWNR